MLDFELVRMNYQPNGTIDVCDILITGNPTNEDVTWETDIENAQAFYNSIIEEYRKDHRIEGFLDTPYQVRKDVAEWIEYAIERREPEWEENDYEDGYDDWLDEVWDGTVLICGYSYPPSKALEAVDPIAYRCGTSQYLDAMFEEFGESEDYKTFERGFDHIRNEFMDWWKENNLEPDGYIDPNNVEDED